MIIAIYGQSYSVDLAVEQNIPSSLLPELYLQQEAVPSNILSNP